MAAARHQHAAEPAAWAGGIQPGWRSSQLPRLSVGRRRTRASIPQHCAGSAPGPGATSPSLSAGSRTPSTRPYRAHGAAITGCRYRATADWRVRILSGCQECPRHEAGTLNEFWGFPFRRSRRILGSHSLRAAALGRCARGEVDWGRPRHLAVSGRVDLVGTREGSTYRMRHPHGSRCRLRRRRRSLTRPRPPTSRWSSVVSSLVGASAFPRGYGRAHCQRRPGSRSSSAALVRRSRSRRRSTPPRPTSMARARAEHVGGGDEATPWTGDE
jgi:hypothetical protein